jgi:hypothetical protein
MMNGNRVLFAPETESGAATEATESSLIDDQAEPSERGGHPAEREFPPDGTPSRAPEIAGRMRPEHIPEAFWDPVRGEPRIEAMMKSWTDLRRQISRGDHKPPARAEEYRLPLPEGAPQSLVASDDPILASVRQSAHAAGISQAQFDALARPFLSEFAKIAGNTQAPAAARQAYVNAELAKLGPGGEAQLRGLATWGQGLLRKGAISPEEFNEFRGFASSAAGVRLLAKLRALAGEQPVPVDAAAIPDEGSLEDAYTLIAKGDDASKAKARRILERLDRAGLLPARAQPGVGIRA